jgi:hypothetical protein
MSTPYLITAGASEHGWSRLDTVGRCPRLFALKYRLGLFRKGSAAQGIGSLVHAGLAQHYARIGAAQPGGIVIEGRLFTDPADLATGQDAITRGSEGVPEADVRRALDAFGGYVAHYAGRDRFRVLHVEAVYSAEIHDEERGVSYPFTARVDLVTEGPDGKVSLWDHKCLPGDARVWTTTGDVPMRTLVDTDVDVAAWTKGGFLTGTPALRAVPAGVQRVHRIVFAHGATGRFGYRHPILTSAGWVQAEDLRPGDLVAVPLRYPQRSEINVPDAFLRVLGQLISDGALKESSLRWTKKDADKRARFITDVRALGADPVEGFPSDPKRAPWVNTRGPVLRGLLEAWGVARVRSPERCIPEALLSRLSERQIGQLLSGLWAGDGHAGVGANKRTRICFSGRSERLCKDVQRLLLALGIPATLTASSVAYQGARRPVWTTTVVGDGKARFLALVDAGVIPSPHLDTSHLWPSLNTTDALRGLGRVEGDVWWVPVKGTRFDGEEECYDLEVPEHHTFVAEGVVTHNTTVRIETKHATAYSMSGQIVGHRWLAGMVYGEKFGGYTLNMIQTTSARFERPPLLPAPALVRAFPATVIERERRIADLAALAPDSYPLAVSELICVHRYGTCEAAERCRWGA